MKELIIRVDDPNERAWDGSRKVFETKELVRCKYCKKRYTMSCGYFYHNGQIMEDDWFCADGERKD